MRAITLAVLAVLAAASGCGTDPCAGLSGTCIAAKVTGNVRVDQLRISVQGLTAQVTPPSGPSSFTLPVKVGIQLPAGTASPAIITVDGLVAGLTLSTSGPQTVPFGNGTTSYTFNLVDTSSNGDMGNGGDMTLPLYDVQPTTLNFPDTPRGGMSTGQLTFTNRSASAVLAGPKAGVDAGMGGDASFQVDMVRSTCTFNADMTVTVPPGGCTLAWLFQPTTSGPHSNTTTGMLGPLDISFTLKGKGLRAWSAEMVANSVTSPGDIWGTGPDDVYLAGADSMGSAFHTAGDGTWKHVVPATTAPAGFPTPNNFNSVSGSGRSVVFVGFDNAPAPPAPNNTMFTWNYDSSAGAAIRDDLPVGTVNSMVNGSFVKVRMLPTGDLLALTQMGHAVSGFGSAAPRSWTWQTISASTNVDIQADPSGLQIACGRATGTFSPSLYFYSAAIWVALPWDATVVAPDFLAAWIKPGGSEFFFAGTNGTIAHYTGTGSRPVLETAAPGSTLMAISGVVDGAGATDIYTGGTLGNKVMHSTGNGTWNPVTIPQTGATRAIWVAPNGDVFVGQDMGQVSHFY